MKFPRMPLVCLIVAFLSATATAAPEHKNLQVLDKNISKDDLKKMMEGFAAQLGVKCRFVTWTSSTRRTTRSRRRTRAR